MDVFYVCVCTRALNPLTGLQAALSFCALVPSLPTYTGSGDVRAHFQDYNVMGSRKAGAREREPRRLDSLKTSPLTTSLVRHTHRANVGKQM